jgi:hypothetical protein
MPASAHTEKAWKASGSLQESLSGHDGLLFRFDLKVLPRSSWGA